MKASNQRKDEGEAKQHRNKPEREEAEGGSARGSTPVERMYFAWNDALSRNDAQTLLALYAEDAHFESPLVPHLLGGESGVLCGREQLKPLFAMLAERKPSARQYYRTGYLTDGKRLIWEYPRRCRAGRANGLYRGDGVERRRPDRAPLRVLGLVRRPSPTTQRLPPLIQRTGSSCRAAHVLALLPSAG
jgi:hypothetical protein